MIHLALLSGLLSDEAAWSPVADQLAADAAVMILSFPGFSSIPAMADHALSVLPEHFALAGHSMGGRVALEIYRRAPERVTALALLNTGVHPVGAQEQANRGRLVDLSFAEGMAALAHTWLPPMMGVNAERTARLMPGLVAVVARATPDSFKGQARALLERPDASTVLPLITVPLLLATGADDGWSPPKQHEEMRRLAPGAVLTIIPDAGHFMPVEQPELVAAALRAWLAAVGTAG